MDKLLRRAKRRQILKIVVISIASVVLVAVAGVFGIDRMTNHQAGQLYNDLNTYHTLKEPNVEVASELLNGNTLVGGSIVTQEYKDLDGYIVKWQRLSSNYTSFRHELDQTLTATGSVTANHTVVNADSGQKVALFYTSTKDLPNEAAKLPDGKVGEVALTFNKPYTYAQLRRLLPKDVNLTWGYVFSEPTADQGLLPHQAIPIGIELSYGLALNYWQKTLKSYWPHKSTPAYRRALHANNQTLTFAGAMVTGRSEALRQLAKADYVAGTSIGATTDRVSYIHPTR